MPGLFLNRTRSRALLRGTDERRYGFEPRKHHEGPPEDPGAVLGADVRRAGRQVPDRLHVREGAQEGSAQAGPALLLPDGGGEGQPRVRRDGRRDPRQHVRQVQERWMEWQKLFLSIIPFPEISAARAMPL